MKVKIIKAEHPTYWYSKHIGEVFEVVEGRKGDYDLAKDDGFSIAKDDCEIVEEG